MENTNTDIRRFLDEEMKAEEAASFREKILTDPVLQREIQEYVLIQKAAEAIALEKITTEAEEGIRRARGEALSRRRRWWGLGAFVGVCLVMFASVFYLNSAYDREVISQESLIMPRIYSNRGGSTAEEKQGEGINYFHNKENYEQASIAFYDALALAEEKDSFLVLGVRYYLAHSVFKEHKYDQAKELFAELLKEGLDNELQNDLTWNYWLTRFVLDETSLAEAPSGVDRPEVDLFLQNTSSIFYHLFNE